MSIGSSLQFHRESTFIKNSFSTYQSQHRKAKEHVQLHRLLSSRGTFQDPWCIRVCTKTRRPSYGAPYRYSPFTCRSIILPGCTNEIPILKATTVVLARTYNRLRGYPILYQLVPAVGLVVFTLWGLEPLMRHCRSFWLHRNDSNWKKSRTHYFFASYLQPLLLWTGAIIVCRVLDPVILPSEPSQAVKQRLLNFTKSLSTVLAVAYCLSSLIQQTQKFFLETNEANDARKMGFQFAGKAIYTAVWVAAISLFMELLGFSTQKWLTAGGLGTVLLTLAGREIFTNFLSSVMIHATRPFVLNEWIQTRIEGYEVSGTVEHVGWWSPTIIRGDDREAVHIPNHKFTVTVVRNLSQKSHWRVKTHFAISHLDANKISNIVADMRKVLAKNPQIEQQRLHRRVFFDYIDPENQAFMILISCFVKTSHFEEYLCVKEGVLLDLLRVISHHRARLATPIRTVQKIYGDMDLENVPFAETVITRGARTPMNRPLFLIEPETRINGDDKAKSRLVSRTNEEQSSKSSSTSSDQKAATPVSDASHLEDRQPQKVSSSSGDSHSTSDGTVQDDSEDKLQQKKPKSPPSESSMMPSAAVLNSKGLNIKESGLDKIPPSPSDLINSRRDESTQVASAAVKQETERAPTRSALEDNIVLGMALDGSKRTLPIEEGMGPSSEAKEFAGLWNGNGLASSTKEKKDGSISSSAASAGTSIDPPDSEK